MRRQGANATIRKCYRDTGAACATGGKSDAKIAGAIAAIPGKLASKCTSVAIAAAGLGDDTSAAQLGARVGEACRQQAASLVSRSFGGPDAAVLAGADAATRKCLDTAFLRAGKLQRSGFKTAAACIKKDHAGGSCDAGATTAKIAKLADKTRAAIEKTCVDVDETLGGIREAPRHDVDDVHRPGGRAGEVPRRFRLRRQRTARPRLRPPDAGAGAGARCVDAGRPRLRDAGYEVRRW